MPKEFLFLETKDFPFDSGIAEALSPLGKVQNTSADTLSPNADIIAMVSEIRSPRVVSGLAAAKENTSAFFFSNPQDCKTPFANSILAACVKPERNVGVKNFLLPGSNIYSEKIFQAAGLGAKLDPCFDLAKLNLATAKALSAWSSLNALLYFALLDLPTRGDAGSGEHIEIQAGSDENIFVLSIRFVSKTPSPITLLFHPQLDIPRQSADFFECRVLKESNSLELTLAYSKKIDTSIRLQSACVTTKCAIENAQATQAFAFLSFQKIKEAAPAETKIGKGFRKKLSDQIVQIETSAESKLAQRTEIVATVENKIAELKATALVRDEQIAKLTREIEQLKERPKAIAEPDIKDANIEGLKANTKRLGSELADSAAREKDLLTVIDKAVKLKDEALKRQKEAEIKLRQIQEGTNVRCVQLEKQLEETKNQNKELNKKITLLAEQKKKAA